MLAPLNDERIWLWEHHAGRVASLAGRTTAAAGVTRVAPVYTPPEHRRRGYATTITARCSQEGLRRGAQGVVLLTDLGNSTSNAIYQQIGFRPKSDRHIVRLERHRR